MAKKSRWFDRLLGVIVACAIILLAARLDKMLAKMQEDKDLKQGDLLNHVIDATTDVLTSIAGGLLIYSLLPNRMFQLLQGNSPESSLPPLLQG